MWVGFGGFLGANARYWLGGWVAGRLGAQFPYSTLIINVSGSFLLGLFVTLFGFFSWRPQSQWTVAIGFLGAYTTFSTYELESLTLLREGSPLLAFANLFGSLLAGLVAAWLGVVTGRLFTGGIS
ncbi:MAG: fluoride efflux transporter CrcB [Armatimonadetes bacterium]|nr:fluoride efflux transporter CrcB [Armatimonadota bacterium]